MAKSITDLYSQYRRLLRQLNENKHLVGQRETSLARIEKIKNALSKYEQNIWRTKSYRKAFNKYVSLEGSNTEDEEKARRQTWERKYSRNTYMGNNKG